MKAMALAEMEMSGYVPRPAATHGASLDVQDIDLALGGQTILRNLSCRLAPGEFVLLRGENGSGKTVLLNMLAGYVRPDRGSIRLKLHGAWIDAGRATPESLARKGVGRLWQDIRLFPSMTVLQNVLAATKGMHGENPLLALLAPTVVARQERNARERALHNLALMGMADRARSSCDMLSIGQMKRVALARLLQMEASLLLLDEPFAGLDGPASATLSAALDTIQKDRTRTILLIEHRADAMARSVDHVWVMKDGRIENV